MRKSITRLLSWTLAIFGVGLGAFLITYSYVVDPDRAEAAVETWLGGSGVQHAGAYQEVTALGVINQSGWINHFNNSVGSWNIDVSPDPFDWDWTFNGSAHVAVLETNSWDESNWDSLKAGLGQYPLYNCWQADQGGTWGSVAPYTPYVASHYNNHKVCIWPSRIPNYTNGSGWHYRQLTIQHELGHVLKLGDDRRRRLSHG